MGLSHGDRRGEGKDFGEGSEKAEGKERKVEDKRVGRAKQIFFFFFFKRVLNSVFTVST